MGKTPFHRRAWHPARRMIVLTTVFALVVAPLVVILTHGPAAHQFAASMAAEIAEEIAEEIAAHGHAHGHDHSYAHDHAHDEDGDDRPGGSPGGHNPADHDHQLHALVCQAARALKPFPDEAQCAFNEVFRHLTPEGPRRPPRPV